MRTLKIVSLCFLLLTISVCNFNLLAQNQDINFHRLTVEDGLSNGNVNQIFQDSKGFIWMCTDDGLNLYDGYSFKIYKHSAADTNSISNNNTLSIIEDQNGTLWIGTHNGLNSFDRSKQIFKKYFFNQNDPQSISQNHIPCMCIGLNKQLYLGTDNGLNSYNAQTDNFTRYNVVKDKSGNLRGNSISSLKCDKNGIIWMSEYFGGLTRLNPTNGVLKNYPINPENGPVKNIITSICPAPDGNIWLGLYSGEIVDFNPASEYAEYYQNSNKGLIENNAVKGIFQQGDILWFLKGKSLACMNIRDRKTSIFNNDQFNPKSFPKGSPLSISKSKDDNIWIGIEGVAVFNPKAEKFSSCYFKLPKESSKVKQNFATSFLKDIKDNLYVGTFLDGLIKLNLNTGNFIRLTTPSVFSSSVISSIYPRKDGNYWITTSKGLVLFDPEYSRVLKHYTHNPNDTNSLYHEAAEFVCEDKKGKIWISTQESLDVLDPATNTFSHFTRANLKGLSHYKVTSIFCDKDGQIWVGTYNGLNKIDPNTFTITTYGTSLLKENELSDLFISSNGIYQDKKGFIWISTKNGLNKFNTETNSFTTYFQADGLLSDNVSQVIEDNSGNLWVTSASGITKINFENKIFRNYTSSDGLDISTAALYKDNNGYLYLGGRHENFYRFHPDSIHDNLIEPEVYITNFLLFNKPVGVFPYDKYSPLKQNIQNTKEIVLNYKQSDFAFEFTALNYYLPGKNRFAYIMEGYNEEWIYTNANRRIANYTNLNHGEYVFRVKASNNDGVWNETGISVKIKILPPPWKTSLAYLLYAILILALLSFSRYIMIRQINLKNSLTFEHLEREREKEFHQIKTKFFTNISHEFRTPLTLISGPINKLISSAKKNNANKEQLNYYYLIERNVNRLAQLTNQLLDFRKIETGTMKLEICQGDLVSYTKGITGRFIQFAESKNINLKFSSSEKEIDAWFDPDKLDKVVSNLLSNALKFTPDNGNISILMETSPENTANVRIQVKDSGIGIAKEHQNDIFDRFYQVDSSSKSLFEGTGIGLALAKDLITLFNGTIRVESTQGNGSLFIIDFPADLRSSSAKVTIHKKFEPSVSPFDLTNDNLESEDQEGSENFDSASKKQSLPELKNKPIVLIIEDNKDLRFFISDTLKEFFTIEEAENGDRGIEKAIDIIPDIIISDVRMPVKDGIEVVRILKKDNRTSHIPLILLTALSSIDSKLKGFESGADDYITKPFNQDLLLLKVRNIVTSREKQKEFLLKSIEGRIDPSKKKNSLQPKEIFVNNIDEEFLQNALEIVEQNISDPDFNVEKFSTAIGMEASTLYKKLMALIDMPPGEFIRDIRMKRSAQLLKQNRIPISEIAYMVGFDSPNYFSKVFRKYYNISPTDFILNKNEEESRS